MIEIVRAAIKHGLRFDYVLVDSWFTCFALVQFVVTRRFGYYLLGMAKMGKTRYLYNGKNLTSKEIIDCLLKRKKLKRSNSLGVSIVKQWFTGHSTIGWFFGFKLHLVINEKGEILDFVLTQGNVDDREPLLGSNLLEKIFGKLYGDKGYISQDLFEKLFIDGIHLITKLRKNIKNNIMLLSDKIMLRKRAIIENVNDGLKNICQTEHTRHRNFENFLTNMILCLIAYCFLPKKPTINTCDCTEKGLIVF